MEILTNNIYKDAVDKHRDSIVSTHNQLNHRTQILLLDFDKYSKEFDLKNSMFYIHIDSLPSYCSSRYMINDNCIPLCIKHVNTYFLTFV